MKKYITMQISFVAEYDDTKHDINDILHDLQDIKLRDKKDRADLYDLDIFDWEVQEYDER